MQRGGKRRAAPLQPGRPGRKSRGGRARGASQLWAAPQDACRDLAVLSLRDCDDGNKRILKPNLKEE